MAKILLSNHPFKPLVLLDEVDQGLLGEVELALSEGQGLGQALDLGLEEIPGSEVGSLAQLSHLPSNKHQLLFRRLLKVPRPHSLGFVNLIRGRLELVELT